MKFFQLSTQNLEFQVWNGGNQIKILHVLSMDPGLDYLSNKNCNGYNCLKFIGEPGKVWFYNTDSYYLLHKILEKATAKSLNDFTQE